MSHYLETEDEAVLCATILIHGDRDNWTGTDAIIGDLIEQGLVDMDRGPEAFRAWRDLPDEDQFLDEDAVHQHLVKVYLREVEEDES